MTQSNTGGSPIETETLRRLVADATPGPWVLHDTESSDGRSTTYYQEVWDENLNVIAAEVCRAHGDGGRANMRLIALTPQLAAEVLALRAEIERLRAIVGKGPTHRHIKRGTLYRHLGTARIQSDEPLTDDAEVEVYHGAHGDLWARRKVEFHDGRFAALSQPDSGEGA